MPAPQRKPAGRPLPSRPGPAEAEEGLEETTGNNRATSKADLFNSAQPESGLSISPGAYVAHLVDATHEKGDGQKESVKVSYEIYEGELQGKTVPTWYNLFDKDGNQQRGIGFLKRDMEILGQPPLDYAELEAQLQELAAERILCNITVKQNGQYTNIYLQGVAE